MYGWIWRRIPGTTAGRLAVFAGGVLLAAFILWFLVFPLLEPRVPFDQATVNR